MFWDGNLGRLLLTKEAFPLFLFCPTDLLGAHSASVNKRKEMRSRLGWKVHLSLAGGIVASRHISTTSHLIFRYYLFTIPGKESSFAIVSFIKYLHIFYRRKIIKFFDNNFRFKVAWPVSSVVVIWLGNRKLINSAWIALMVGKVLASRDISAV